MKVPNNQLHSVQNFFEKELQSIYGSTETSALFAYACHEIHQISNWKLAIYQAKKVSESELLIWFRLVKHLKAQRPIQYFFGSVMFYDCQIRINPTVLIPRPETEYLVDIALKKVRHSDIQSAVDVCSGSGCIGIALAKQLSQLHVATIEISEEANALCTENAGLNGVKIDIKCEDILNSTSPLNYDLVISNPPYVLPEDKEQMHPNVLENEPHLALFVPANDPIVFYKKIIDLSPSAKWHFFEGHPDTLPQVLKYGADCGLSNGELLRDLDGKIRFVTFHRP